MKKRILALTLGVCILLSGCSVIHENNTAGADVPVSVFDLSGVEYYGREEKSAVYFFNETSGTLTAELRNLVVSQDTNPAEAAVQQLLQGAPNESMSSVVPEGMSLDYIEYSNNVANVYLENRGNDMQPKQAFILEQAIANTVTDILGATSICVFYNGIRAGFAGYPSGPLKKQTGSIEDAWLSAFAKYMPETAASLENTEPEQTAQAVATDDQTNAEEEQKPKESEISTVLYYVAASGDYILPEVRTVKYIEDNYISGLIEELKNGPQDTAAMISPLMLDTELAQEPVFVDIGGGEYRLELYFSYIPAQSGIANSNKALLSYAALIYTITGFIPNIRSVDIYVSRTRMLSIDGTAGFFDGMERSDFLGYIGSSAPLYFADEGSDLLLETLRSMEQEKTWSARARVLEVLKGPLSGDGDNVWPVVPSGITEDDLLSVDVYNDLAYVNLSAHFKEACAGLSPKNEMLLVYSIVNTLTAMDGINRVQFVIEGKQTDKLAGQLCLSDPFLRNYGIIKGG